MFTLTKKHKMLLQLRVVMIIGQRSTDNTRKTDANNSHTKKLFPTVISSLALLLFVSPASRQFATAQTLEQKMDEVESILIKMEDEVKAFRYEMERVYTSHCDSQTLNECLRNNYNDCMSTFPNQQCAFVMPHCGDTPTSCAGKRGWEDIQPSNSISEVSTPDCNGKCLGCFIFGTCSLT